MRRPFSKFDHLPREIYTQEVIRKLDQQAIEDIGDGGFSLMHKAGIAAFNMINSGWPDLQHIGIFAGVGNNGGDAWVVAALAKERGLKVTLYSLGNIEQQSPSAKEARLMAQDLGVEAQTFNGQIDQDIELILDGLLGIGLQADVRSPVAEAIEVMNQHPAPVLSLDVPSGLDADTGTVRGVAIRAAQTITFIGVKPGLLTADGPDYAGEVVSADLGIIGEHYGVSPSLQRISWHLLQNEEVILSARSGNSHKGAFGHALLVGGDTGMGGAISMTVDACAHAGVGMISCATQPEHVPVILTKRPECMVRAVQSGLELEPMFARATVLGCGPGLGQTSWSELLLQQVLASSLPLVLDADALNILAMKNWQVPTAGREVIMTPHPGEAARLLGVSITDVQADRLAAVKALADKFSAIVLLKGQGSVIASPIGQVALCTDGNPGMASGGMGDVLTGVITSLLAQGLSGWDACCLGACVHSAAADLAVKQLGTRGLLASELMPYIRELVN